MGAAFFGGVSADRLSGRVWLLRRRARGSCRKSCAAFAAGTSPPLPPTPLDFCVTWFKRLSVMHLLRRAVCLQSVAQSLPERRRSPPRRASWRSATTRRVVLFSLGGNLSLGSSSARNEEKVNFLLLWSLSVTIFGEDLSSCSHPRLRFSKTSQLVNSCRVLS